MGVTHSLVSCSGVTSAMSAIGGSTTTITNIIPVKENSVHLVIERTALCRLCHRSFCGEDCYSYHLHRHSKNIPSICDSYKKCLECCKTYEAKPRKRSHGGDRRSRDHICGWGECPICEQQVHVASINVTYNAFQKRRMIPD